MCRVCNGVGWQMIRSYGTADIVGSAMSVGLGPACTRTPLSDICKQSVRAQRGPTASIAAEAAPTIDSDEA
jgi:hypothetical protein